MLAFLGVTCVIICIVPLAVAAVGPRLIGGLGSWMPYFNVFTAGVFVGITFFHILAEGGEKIAALWPGASEATINQIQYAAFLAGFAAILFLERVWISHSHTHTHAHAHAHGGGGAGGGGVPGTLARTKSHGHDLDTLEAADGVSDDPVVNRRAAMSTYVAFCVHSVTAGIAVGASIMSKDSMSTLTTGHSHSHPHAHEVHVTVSKAVPDLHAVRTLASVDESSTLLLPFIFISMFSLHKVMDSVVVVGQLLRCSLPRSTYIWMILLFAACDPLGMVIAAMFSDDNSPLFSWCGLLEAFAGGVLFYIAVSHILAEELEVVEGRRNKFFIFVSGVLAVLWLET